MPNQFDEIINCKIENLGYKNPLYIADNSAKYWSDFWKIFESKFSHDFNFQKPSVKEFQKRIIHLEAINKVSLTKNLFILSLPEGHMRETAGSLLGRLTFHSELFKEYIRKNDSIFFITFYSPLKKELNLDLENSVMIVSGLKEIWSSSENYGERFFPILNNLPDNTTQFRSIQINFSIIRDLLFGEGKSLIQKEIIFNDHGRLVNKNEPEVKKPKKNECYNLFPSKEWDLVKQILIESNNKFIEWIKSYQKEEFDLKQIEEIENSQTLSTTEKETIIKARIGQSSFRKYLLDDYQRCPITQIDDPNLLIASHIWPWKNSKNKERLDPNNGILLSMLFDKLFDQGLITFTDDGKILFSNKLSEKTQSYLSSYKEKQFDLKLNEKRKIYLARHRSEIFKK